MKKVAIGVASVAVIIGGLYIWPPFLMPSPLYAAIYGWRYPKQWQCGSGTLTDNGPGSASDRYIIILDDINLSLAGSYSWELDKLPKERMFLGLNINTVKKSTWETAQEKTKSTLVSVQVSDTNNYSIVNQVGPLGKEWIWSGPSGETTTFVYGDTMIQTTPDKKYTVNLIVSPSGEESNIVSMVVLKGGGWK